MNLFRARLRKASNVSHGAQELTALSSFFISACDTSPALKSSLAGCFGLDVLDTPSLGLELGGSKHCRDPRRSSSVWMYDAVYLGEKLGNG